jgi:hypothetical protein
MLFLKRGNLMNWTGLKSMTKMQWLELGVRMYLGVFLISNAGVGWVIPLADLHLPADADAFIRTLWEIGPLMPAVKLIEALAAVALLTNRQVFLALLVFYPVLFNILCIGMHFFGSVRYSLPMLAGILFLSWRRRKRLLGLMG